MAKVDQQQRRADRLEIAARIVELSEQRLSLEPCKNHIALKDGTGSYSNAVIVSDSDYVKFLIRSEELLNRAKTECFEPKVVKSAGPWAGMGFRFLGLRLNDIQAHEGLFRDLVKESMNELKYRRGGGKKP